jgi:hypothetical protein
VMNGCGASTADTDVCLSHSHASPAAVASASMAAFIP